MLLYWFWSTSPMGFSRLTSPWSFPAAWWCWNDGSDKLGLCDKGRIGDRHIIQECTWWLIPLSKWVITPVINGISRVNPLITGVITHLLSGMSHQVGDILLPTKGQWKSCVLHPFMHLRAIKKCMYLIVRCARLHMWRVICKYVQRNLA